MKRFLPYVLKTLLRHRTRTLLTVSGSAVAFFVLAFVGAISDGLAQLGAAGEADRSLIVFQANRFCPFTSLLPEDYGRTIEKVPGVADMVPIKVYTNNCRASLDVVVFHGIPPEKLRTARDLKLIAGDWNDFERQTDAALVGRGVAGRRNLSVGQRFSIGGVTTTIAGIYTAAMPAEEDYIYTHLDFLQRMRSESQIGKVTQFEVRLADGASSQAVAEKIDAAFRSGPVATDTRPKGVFQADSVADLVELVGFARWLGYACVVMVLALVSTTTVMSVQDRRSEHAVLQTIGVSSPLVFMLVIEESAILSLIGGAVGLAAGLAVLYWSGMTIGAEAVTIAFTPSLDLAVTGMLAALVVGVLAGLIPAWQAARADIVPALRQI